MLQLLMYHSEIACEFGMETSGLNLLAYSTTLPTPPNGPQPNVQEVNHPPNSQFSTIPTHKEYDSWYYYLTEIMLRKLEMRIDIFYQDKRREAYRRAGEPAASFFGSMVEALQEFDYQLTRYYETLPPAMQLSLDDLAPCLDELRQLLRWRLLCVKHDITIPALYVILHNDISGWPRDLVSNLVQMANACIVVDIKILRMAVTKHRHHTTWLCLRTGVRSAMTLIAAEKLAAQQKYGLERLYIPDKVTWESGAHALIRGLRHWSKESRDCPTYLAILRQLHPMFCSLE